MIEQAFHQLLTTNAAVLTLANDRVFFIQKPQDVTEPCVVLSVIDKQHPHTFEGHGGYVQGTMQVDCFGPTYPKAKELAKAVREALDSRSGWCGVMHVDYIEIEAERDVPRVPPAGKAEATTYGVSLDADFQHPQ